MTNSIDHNPPQTESLDLVLAYILGDVTERERYEVESKLASGDPELLISYHQAMAIFAELPRALTAAIPPPFVKERVMARVQQDAEQYVIANTASHVYRPPMSILSRVLNFVPGYGSVQYSTLFARAFASRSVSGRSGLRTAGFAMTIFVCLFASAYAFTEVGAVLKKAEHDQTKVVERVRNTKAFKEKYHFIHSAAVPVSQANLDGLSILGAESGVATPQEEIPMSDTKQSTTPSLQPAKLSAIPLPKPSSGDAIPIARPEMHSDRFSIDMDIVHAQFYFTSDPKAIHFTLAPINGVQAGSGKIYWNNMHAEALFMVGDLKPTSSDSRYALYYVLDDGTQERVLDFSAVSTAHQSYVLTKAPGPHVKGAKLVLESGVNSGSIVKEPILSATTRIKAAK